MPLGTLDRTPPPFFRQGPSALTKLMFCSALALFLMVADTKFKLTQPLRAGVATLLFYPQQMLLVPVAAWRGAGDYLGGLQQAQAGEAEAQRELAAQAERSLRVDQLVAENAQLRSLLELRPTLAVRSHAAQVLYEAPDRYSRKVVIDRGASDGIVEASAVINQSGVLGQVTRVYPLSAEVTLLSDKDAAIPVLNTRSRVRSVAFGGTNAANVGMELRYMPGNADVQTGDTLETSGVDGVYPAGLPVAKVMIVERKQDSGFARILLAPAAGSLDGIRHLLVLEPVGLQMTPRPQPVDEPKGAPGARRAASRPAIATTRPATAASTATPGARR